MEYKIAKSGNIEGLEKEVNRMIEEDWRPIGSICSLSWKVHNAVFWAICQPMIYFNTAEEATSEGEFWKVKKNF